jgi:DNA transposition AAA+ family ATPase
MGDDLKETDFNDARIAEVRAAVRQMMAQHNLSNSVVAREAGVGESTFAAFLGEKYQGKNSTQALTLQRWLTARHASAAVKQQGPRGPDFVRTRTSEAFGALLEHAQFTPDFSVIVGDPGIGKTMTARTYTRNGHNVWMITAQPLAGSASALVNALAEALGVTDQMVYGLSTSLSKAIQRRLKAIQSLLIVDEAQHLSSQALDQLRTYHDLCECGVALLGNHSIFRQLEGGTRSADYAQLFSRVGMRIVKKRPHSDDIEALLEAWGITDNAVRKVARAVARRPGALRTMTKVLRQAHLRARAEDRAVTAADMINAAAQLGDEKPLELDA